MPRKAGQGEIQQLQQQRNTMASPLYDVPDVAAMGHHYHLTRASPSPLAVSTPHPPPVMFTSAPQQPPLLVQEATRTSLIGSGSSTNGGNKRMSAENGIRYANPPLVAFEKPLHVSFLCFFFQFYFEKVLAFKIFFFFKKALHQSHTVCLIFFL